MEVIFFILILIFSVVLHEVAHGYTALWLGDRTAKMAGRLTLNPIPHIDPLGSVILPALMALIPGGVIFGWAKPVPFNPYNLRAGKWGPAIVAVAGPISNIVIAGFFAILIRSSELLNLSSSVVWLSGTIVLMNIALALFNLIPIPPLDGSKILFACLPYRLRYIQEMLESNQLILIIVVILGASVIISPMIGILFSVFTGLPL